MAAGPAGSELPALTTTRLVEASNHLIGFRRHLHAEVVPGEAVYLFSERGVTALAGKHIEVLAPLLDGTRDLPALLRELPEGTPPQLATDLIARLTGAGLVTIRTEPAASSDLQSLAYWDASGLDPATAVANLFRTQLTLVTVGSIESEVAARELRATGLTVTTDPTEIADLSVVLCSDYLDPQLRQIDTAHRAAGRPWLLARPVGSTIWIGPIFQPSSTGCWNCLAARLSKHRMAEDYVQRALGRVGPAPRCVASVPQLTAMAMHLVSLEASKWLSGYRYAGQRSVWTFDSLELQGRRHELHARPQCPDCGDPTLMAGKSRQPIVLTTRRKAKGSNGGYRSMTPQQVLDRYRHLISPVTGVIKEIGRVEHGPAFFNSFRSGTDLPSGPRSLRGLRSALKVENGGKGVTALDAEVSALCEALERHSGNFQGDEERIRGSLRSLGDQALHPNTCQLYHDRQFSGRVAWNAAHSPFQYVCMPFDENAAIDWTPVWSLTKSCHRLLPTNLLYFGAPVEAGARYGRADSNGNAAGASLEDAVLQGLLELIERDAVSLWWYNRTRQPAVDLDSFSDPWVADLREVYRELGREVWALDLTSDLAVPAVAALSRQIDGPSERIMFGFGAHLDPGVALRRALTEMNQMMPAVLGADETGRHGWADDPDAAHWLDRATIADQSYLLPNPAARPMRPGSGRAAGLERTDDLTTDVRSIQATLEAIGLELLVLDQTRPDIGLPVVKVLVPGLRHFWARYAPGRLYDVPVNLGLRNSPTPYEELNPIPLFI